MFFFNNARLEERNGLQTYLCYCIGYGYVFLTMKGHASNNGLLAGGNNKTYHNMRLGFVHIDDVIAAHIMAMEAPSASGRIICSGAVAHFEEIVKMLKEKYPMYPIADQ